MADERSPLPGIEPDDQDPWWHVKVPLGPLALAYMLIIGVAVFGFEQLEDQQYQFEAQVLRDDYEQCQATRDSRRVLRDVLKLTDDSRGGSPLPLSSVPGFEKLDPNMQLYLVNLEAAISPDPGGGNRRSEFVKRALELIELPACQEP